MPATTFDDILKKSAPVARTFDEILKFNPYHDARGRFAAANSATSFTIRTKDPEKQHLADRAKEREKERQEGGSAPESDDESPQTKAVHDIEDRIRNQDYETAAVVDKDGNTVLLKDGQEAEVSFSWMETKMMEGNVLTHNHPHSSMFSHEDIVCFVVNDLKEMRATNREGTTYSIKRGEGYDVSKAAEFARNYQGKHMEAIKYAQKDLDDRGFAKKIMNGEITQDQANKEFTRVVSNQMINFSQSKAPAYNLEFSVEKKNVSKSAGTAAFAKSGDSDRDFVLDRKTKELEDKAFQEWLDRSQTKKSMEDSRAVLFIGLKISGADALAIDGGEDPDDDFHVTLAYGHFDAKGDEDDTSVRVQHAIDDIRDLIPDKIRFDAIRRFQASESSDGQDVIYAQVAAGQLEKLHDELLKALKKRGIKLEGTFPEYKPHMTLAYIDPKVAYELHEIDATGTATKVMIGHGWESTKENNYTVMKTDDDKRLVFGWASVSIKVDGEQLEDRQQDMIDPEDLEEAAYEYVLNFRDTGEEHIQSLRKKGKLVESCVFTAEKQRAMGIPEGIVPIGWWIGFKIEDDDAWEKVKNGTYKMFSIEGKANRMPVD